MDKIRIDQEFRDKIPPLTDTEFEQLRENILNDGEKWLLSTASITASTVR